VNPDLTFLHGRHTPACIASVDKRFDYHTLQLMVQGGVELFYDDRRVEMRGGWLWTCFPGPRIRFHEWPPAQAWEHRYLAMMGPRVADWEVAGLWPHGAEPVESEDDPTASARLARWMDEAIDADNRSGRWSRLRAINALERVLLDRAERRDRAAPSRPPWVEQVLARLGDLEAPEPDYADLAEAHGMSLSTLRRQFRIHTGSSPHDHRVDARVTAARELLGETDVPIKTIAARIGYRDIFYFTRQFKQRVGVTPAAFRRSRQ
jgi:AraC family transcriptional regulator of arabinose operon